MLWKKAGATGTVATVGEIGWAGALARSNTRAPEVDGYLIQHPDLESATVVSSTNTCPSICSEQWGARTRCALYVNLVTSERLELRKIQTRE